MQPTTALFVLTLRESDAASGLLPEECVFLSVHSCICAYLYAHTRTHTHTHTHTHTLSCVPSCIRSHT